MLKRSCGCVQEFQHYKVDKYRADRQAKFQSTRCPACVAKLVEEERKALPPRKGEIIKQLPPGTQVTLSRAANGCWGGTLSANGTLVELVAVAKEAAPGMQAVALELARRWLAAREKGEQRA
jgi:hypothetical protein